MLAPEFTPKPAAVEPCRVVIQMAAYCGGMYPAKGCKAPHTRQVQIAPSGCRVQGEPRRPQEESGCSVALSKKATKSRYQAVLEDPLQLLVHNVKHDGWTVGLALEKCFYVRGLMWFEERVLAGKLKVTACKSYIPEMKRLLADRKSWHGLGFDWTEPYAARQFVDVFSERTRATPMCSKAYETIALCEVIAEDLNHKDSLRPCKEDVYEKMSIEPAVSYIHGFTSEICEEVLSDPVMADRVRAQTGQRRLGVFRAMASGKTVTHKLAVRLYERVLRDAVGTVRIDPPEFRYDPRSRLYEPAKDEELDVPDSALPALAPKS
ncbi:MAG: hypothetical protein JWL65_3774 [Gammaproteobacteria bacterium]|nr:hypothetical protein [Gammaproteobacteria bacterium]